MKTTPKPPEIVQFQVPEWLDLYEKNIVRASYLVRNLRAHKWILEDPVYADLHPYFNNSLFGAMNNLDLMINLKYLDGSMRVRNVLEANYFARVLALHLYEIFNDMHKLVSNTIREAVIAILGKDGIHDMDSQIKELNTLKKAHINYLKEIRHNLIGHKLDNASKQSDMIKDVDIKRIYDLATKTFGVQLKVTGCYTSIIEKIPHPSTRKP